MDANWLAEAYDRKAVILVNISHAEQHSIARLEISICCLCPVLMKVAPLKNSFKHSLQFSEEPVYDSRGLKMTRGNEISKQPLLLFQDSVCCLLTVGVEMWLRSHILGHTNSCTMQLGDTADCICSLALAVWLQGSSSPAQMGMLFSMQAALTDCGNSKLCLFDAPYSRMLLCTQWRPNLSFSTNVRPMPSTHMDESWTRTDMIITITRSSYISQYLNTCYIQLSLTQCIIAHTSCSSN